MSRIEDIEFDIDLGLQDEPQEPIRLITVDDEPEVVQAIRALLSEMGFEVWCETDPKKAVELAKEVRPDVILLDIMMPELDGYELAELLSQTEDTAAVPIVYLTAKDYEDDFCQSFAHGGTLFIKKPFLASELAETLRVAVSLSKSV